MMTLEAAWFVWWSVLFVLVAAGIISTGLEGKARRTFTIVWAITTALWVLPVALRVWFMVVLS